jgi:DNA polymerase-3 subunit delta'
MAERSDLPSVWDIPAQALAAGALRGAVARGEVGHAWAFLGPTGVGQEAAARGLAAALNCPAPRAPGEPCGTCSVCDRCRRGVFAAYQEFAPTGAAHRVDDVRGTWLVTASRTTTEGSWKILRVVDADRMNEAAANAFLKGLEEPPERTVWILDVADPDELPDTILSRCRSLAFAAWAPADLDAHGLRLGLDDPADRALAVRVAAGSPGALARLADPGEVDGKGSVVRPSGLAHLRAHRHIPARLRAERGFALRAARAIDDEIKARTVVVKAEGRAELTELAHSYGDELPRGIAKQIDERNARREREARTLVVQAALDDLLSWYRDCLLVGAGGDPADALHVDAAEELHADADALGAAGLLRAADLVLATRDELERNLQVGLALEALLLELSTLTMAPLRAGSR